MMRKILGFTLLSVTLVLASLGHAAALEEELNEPQKQLFHEVSKDLRCPTCTGLSILESDAGFSLQMKSAVAEQVKQGQSKENILKFFTERYGVWILREPPKQGFHILAWLLPLGAMVLGPLVLWLFVWRKRQTVATKGIRSTAEIIAEFDELIHEQKRKV